MTAQAAMVEAGRGTAADPDRAIALYRRAVEAGDRAAAERLGQMAAAGALDGKLAPHRAVPWAAAAARAGDDYELLFTLPRGETPPVRAIRIGHVSAGTGLTLMIDGATVPLPATLGWEHG